MREYTVQETRGLMDRGEAVVIDIREADELAVNHVPGMVRLPLSEMQDRLDEVPTDRPVVLFCRSGSRSGMLADQLNALGDWDEVANCVGGILAWHEAGLPYEGAPPS